MRNLHWGIAAMALGLAGTPALAGTAAAPEPAQVLAAADGLAVVVVQQPVAMGIDIDVANIVTQPHAH